MQHEDVLELSATRLNLVCELLENHTEPDVNNVVRLARTQLLVSLFGEHSLKTVAEKMQHDLGVTSVDAIKFVTYLLDSCIPYE